jgi:hypothetical protein
VAISPAHPAHAAASAQAAQVHTLAIGSAR